MSCGCCIRHLFFNQLEIIMSAVILNTESGYSGTWPVVEVVGRLVCLLIDGRKTDFGRSEVRLAR